MKSNFLSALLLGGLSLLTATSAAAATKTWTGAASTDWFNDVNWSPLGRPAAGDTVILDNGGTINFTSPLGFSGTFVWVRGTLTSSSTGLGLATNAVMEVHPGNSKILLCPIVNEGLIRTHDGVTIYLDNGLGTARIVNHGTIESQADDAFIATGTGGGRIENLGNFVKTGGSGATSLAAGIPLVNTGTVEARTGTMQIASGTLSGHFTGAGVNHWAGSFALLGTVNSSNVLINAQLTGTDVTLTGNWTWQTGNWGPGAGYNFTVASNAVLTLIPGNSKILYCPVTNHGTIRLTGSTTLYLDHGYGVARLVNHHLLESTGDESFTANGTGGGRVENHGLIVKSGGGGVTALTSGIPLVNTGTVEARTGTVQITSGTLSGHFTGAGVNHWAGSFTLTGTVNSSNVLINAQITGTDVTLTGNWTWQTGNWGPGAGYDFTVASNAVLTLIAGNSKVLYCPLTNRGTVRLTGPTTLFLDHGYGLARLVNHNLLESTGDDAFTASGTGGGRIENHALFRKTGGGITPLAAGIPLVNTGTVEAQTGMIQIAAGTLSGDFTGNGQNHWTGNLLLVGALNSSNVLINAHVYGTNVTLAGNWTWQTGGIGSSPGNSLSLAAGGLLALVPGNSKILYCPLTNFGTLRLTGNSVLHLDHGLGSATLVNLGVVDSTGNDLFTATGTAGGVVDNRATFTKSGGDGTTTVASGLLFLNTGTVAVLTNVLNLQNGVLTASFNGPGKTVLTGSHTLTGDITAQNLEMQSGNFTSSSARLHGLVTWVTGSLYCQTPGAGATVAGGGTLTLVPGNYKYLFGALTNLGTLRLTGNTALYLDHAFGNTRLVNQGLVDSTGSDLFSASGTAGGVIDNRATFRKSGGAGDSTVSSGLLFLNTATGTVNVQTQALNLQWGSLMGAFSGSGKTLLTGNHTLIGDLHSQNVELQSGNFTSASARLHGTIRWVAGLLYCQTAGAGATVAADGTLTFVPGNYKYLYGALTNLGTLRFTGNTALYLDNAFGNTRLINLNLLDSTGSDLITHSGSGGGVVDNRATFRKSGGSGDTTVGSSLLFLNTSAGVVQVQTQGVNLQNGLLSGTFAGSGRTILTGNHTLAGDLYSENVELQSGNFTVSGAQLHGALKWVTGSVFTAGGLGGTLAQDCTLTLVPGNYKYLYGSLTNRGALLLTGNTALYLDNGYGNARLANYGLVESLGDDTFAHSGTGGGVLENRGYWRKSGGMGSTTFASTLWFVHGGALEAFRGTFAVTGSSFIQAGGTMSFRLNSATDYGRINFTGVAPLGGGLAAQVAPGYSPAIGSQFFVVASQGTNGAFAGYDLAAGYTWSVFTTNTFTRLTVTGVTAPGASAVFTKIEQIAPQVFDLHLLIQPNRPYHMEASHAVGPGSSWQYLGPFSSTTSNYVYRHTALGVLPPQQFFRAVSP
jgi:hypothetical protein